MLCHAIGSISHRPVAISHTVFPHSLNLASGHCTGGGNLGQEGEPHKVNPLQRSETLRVRGWVCRGEKRSLERTWCSQCSRRTPGCGPHAPLQVEFRKLDLLDRPAVEALFKEFSFGAVIHFAGLKVRWSWRPMKDFNPLDCAVVAGRRRVYDKALAVLPQQLDWHDKPTRSSGPALQLRL